MPVASSSPKQASLFSVSTQKIRTRRGHSPGREIRGYLFARPEVGSPMIMFREDSGRRTVTTRVTRVLAQNRELFVETENSVYRIRFHGRVVYRDRRPEFQPMLTRELALSSPR